MPKRPTPAPPRCTATTRTGKTCKNARLPGEQRCRVHSEAAASARPKLDAPFVKAAAEALERGLTIKDAAAVTGIAERTWHGWTRQGEADLEAGKGGTAAAQFVQAATRARAQARSRMVEVIQSAAMTREVPVYDKNGPVLDDDGSPRMQTVPGDWRAAAFYLERTDPEHWAKRDKIEHSGSVAGETMTVVPEGDRRAEVIATLAQALPPELLGGTA